MTGPVVTSVTFSTNVPLVPGTPAQLASRLRDRAVAHIDRVKVGPTISAFLEAHPTQGDVGEEILRLTALVETVLDQCRTTVRSGMAADLAIHLIPILKEKLSDH